MSVVVVDRLQIIDIEHHGGKSCGPLGNLPVQLPDAFFIGHSVPQPGQTVDVSLGPHEGQLVSEPLLERADPVSDDVDIVV